MARWTVSLNTYQDDNGAGSYSIRMWRTEFTQDARKPHKHLSGTVRVDLSRDPREALQQLLVAVLRDL